MCCVMSVFKLRDIHRPFTQKCWHSGLFPCNGYWKWPYLTVRKLASEHGWLRLACKTFLYAITSLTSQT